MKILKRLVISFLIISTVLTLMTSCKDGESGVKDDNDKPSDVTDISEYTIVRADKTSHKLGTLTANFKKSILEFTGAELSVKTDYLGRGETLDESGKEILIGNTNRSASTEALNELSESHSTQAFIIKVTDGKICITGFSENDIIIGIKYFMKNYVMNSESDGTLPVKSGESITEKTGAVLYMTDDFTSVVLEYSTDIYLPETKKSTQECTYGKIIKLEHNGENNGILLATHETVGWNDSRYPIYRSTDDGTTWEQISLVSDTYNQSSIVGYQPYLYELPANMGSFKEGTLLMSACTRIGGRETIMVLYYSTDLGETWTAFCNVDSGGGYNLGGWSSEGLWEPILMYEEETKRIYCFYSDETDANHNQKLVYKYSTDLENWSEKYEMVAPKNKELRPGMIAITKLGNGKYALAYEMVGESYQPIYLKFADSLDGWIPEETGKIIRSADGVGLGSAPAIVWTPAGGECGTLFVTAHHNHYLSGVTSTADLLVSFDYGETFVVINNPIMSEYSTFTPRCGYSPGFFVDKDGKVYYVNDPTASEGSLNEKFMFARIKIY